MNQNVSDDIIIKVEDLTIAYEDKPVLLDQMERENLH